MADCKEDLVPEAKAERREKKEKKRAAKLEREKLDEQTSNDNATETSAKKRKGDALLDEIEIDINLPEPASKKASRKAKKAKLNSKTTTTKDDKSTHTKEEEKPGKRSDYGVWIGNLPWSTTRDSLRKFFLDNAEMKSEQITRIHLPPPTKPPNPNWTTKPLNKGFAYVDFSTELAMYSAIALTETKMDGRALLIKNAKSFEGRPDKPKTEEAQEEGSGKGGVRQGHPPNKRVFVGNLSFDVTKDDLHAHYRQCGVIEQLHMATFEDSGKCKGYAWITFGDIESATSAVQGYVYRTDRDIKKLTTTDASSSSEGDAVTKKSGKKRKWSLNKLMGRDLRCEFAEDPTTRYNKRYGKDKPEQHDVINGVNSDRWKTSPRMSRNSSLERRRSIRGRSKVVLRTLVLQERARPLSKVRARERRLTEPILVESTKNSLMSRHDS